MANVRSVLLMSSVAAMVATQVQAEGFLSAARDFGGFRSTSEAEQEHVSQGRVTMRLGVFARLRSHDGVKGGAGIFPDGSFSCPGCGQQVSVLRSAEGSFATGHRIGCTS